MSGLLARAYEYVKERGWPIIEYDEGRGVLKFKYNGRLVTVSILNVEGVDVYDVKVEGYQFSYVSIEFNEDAVKMAMNREGALDAIKDAIEYTETRYIVELIVRLLKELGYEASIKNATAGEFTVSFRSKWADFLKGRKNEP
jgi:hypothetical protein